MSLQQQAETTDTNVPVNLQVNQNGGVTGLTAVVAVRDGSTTNSYLDFNDQTFKTAGWVAQTAALADIGGGVYVLSGGLDVSTMVGLAGNHLILEYNVTGSVSGDAVDVVLLQNHVYDVAAPGDAMDLVANAVDASAIATDAINADAIAADAIALIQAGLATASVLDNLDEWIRGSTIIDKATNPWTLRMRNLADDADIDTYTLDDGDDALINSANPLTNFIKDRNRQ